MQSRLHFSGPVHKALLCWPYSFSWASLAVCTNLHPHHAVQRTHQPAASSPLVAADPCMPSPPCCNLCWLCCVSACFCHHAGLQLLMETHARTVTQQGCFYSSALHTALTAGQGLAEYRSGKLAATNSGSVTWRTEYMQAVARAQRLTEGYRSLSVSQRQNCLGEKRLPWLQRNTSQGLVTAGSGCKECMLHTLM